METQDAFLKRFKVGDVFRNSRGNSYYRITRKDEVDTWYMTYTDILPPQIELKLPKGPEGRRNLLSALSRGTLFKVNQQELLTKILTGEIKS